MFRNRHGNRASQQRASLAHLLHNSRRHHRYCIAIVAFIFPLDRHAEWNTDRTKTAQGSAPVERRNRTAVSRVFIAPRHKTKPRSGGTFFTRTQPFFHTHRPRTTQSHSVLFCYSTQLSLRTWYPNPTTLSRTSAGSRWRPLFFFRSPAPPSSGLRLRLRLRLRRRSLSRHDDARAVRTAMPVVTRGCDSDRPTSSRSSSSSSSSRSERPGFSNGASGALSTFIAAAGSSSDECRGDDADDEDADEARSGLWRFNRSKRDEGSARPVAVELRCVDMSAASDIVVVAA